MKLYSEIFSTPKETNSKELLESVILDVYGKLPHNQVASIIEKHHDVQVTNTLVEKYIELASSRKFTLDPVAFEIRKLNKFDYNFLDETIEFILEDNSTMVITKECYEDMKEHLTGNQEAIEFMAASEDNFMKVFEIINKQLRGK